MSLGICYKTMLTEKEKGTAHVTFTFLIIILKFQWDFNTDVYRLCHYIIKFFSILLNYVCIWYFI